MEVVSSIAIEKVEEFVIEIEEAEGILRAIADLCSQAEEPSFCSRTILKEVGKILYLYLDKSQSARAYFLRREAEDFSHYFGFLGELKKLEIKYGRNSYD